jgi:hypothetical protein
MMEVPMNGKKLLALRTQRILIYISASKRFGHTFNVPWATRMTIENCDLVRLKGGFVTLFTKRLAAEGNTMVIDIWSWIRSRGIYHTPIPLFFLQTAAARDVP